MNITKLTSCKGGYGVKENKTYYHSLFCTLFLIPFYH